MNVFFLASAAAVAAARHCDVHVVKMILETCQLLYATYEDDADVVFTVQPYRVTHRKHPMALWAKAARPHWLWLLRLGEALLNEYTSRTSKVHACSPHFRQFRALGPPPSLPATASPKDWPGPASTLLATSGLPPGIEYAPVCLGEHTQALKRDEAGNIHLTKSSYHFTQINREAAIE